MPNTQARPVPWTGSNDPKLVIAATKVSAVRSATTCGSPLRRAKYAVTASTLARYSRSNSAAAPASADGRRACAVLSVTPLVAVSLPSRHTPADAALAGPGAAQRASAGLIAGGHRAGRIRTPGRPGSGIQRGRHPETAENQDVQGGRDSAAAVDARRRRAVRAQGRIVGPQLLGYLEQPVRADVVRARGAQRTGDVARAGLGAGVGAGIAGV